MTAALIPCFWCGRLFAPRHDGGRLQRYCSPACRRALDAAARRFVASAIADGRLTVADLRYGKARVATRALPAINARTGAAPSAPTGGMTVHVPAWALDDLIELGVLNAASRGDGAAVKLAILVEIAVTAALRRRGVGA
jgi:hypothetical protein